MAAMCVLETGRSLRRLTACDVVVGTSCIMQRRWFDSGYMVCVSTWGASAVLFFFSTRRRTRILRSSLFALWCVGLRVTLNGECAQSFLQLPPSRWSGISCSLSGCTLLGAMLGSTVGTCYASAPVFWKAFFVKANSIGASQFGEVRTVSASGCLSCYTLKSGHYFHEPCVFGSRLLTVSVLLQKSFSCVRHRRGGGVAGSLDSQVTATNFVSETHCSVVVPGGHTHRSSKPASTTTTTTTTTRRSDSSVTARKARFVIDMSLHGDHGAAWRRRQRRLRSWWRHKQQTVAAVLATYQHHSAPTGTEDGRGARDELHGYAPEDARPQAAGAQHFAMDAGEAPAAGRPAPLLEVLTQSAPRSRSCSESSPSTRAAHSDPLLGPKSFLGWPGMMGMENDIG